MKITVKQLQSVLKEMELYNFALASVEDDPELFEIWKKPSFVLSRDDPKVEHWRRKIGISNAAIDDFFARAQNH